MTKKPIIILVGPTAVGKTSISIDVAKKVNAEIISGDSMQIYKYMDIGTAKVKEDEKQGIKHYMIDEITPDEDFNVSKFKEKSEEYMNLILSKNKLPMIVGGTGLYINSLVYELDFSKAICNNDLRKKYACEAEEKGNEFIHEKLAQIDPLSAQRIHINDTKRIIRALEIYHETGKPMSAYYKNFRKYNNNYNIAYFALNMDRKKLYDRINIRVDMMIKEGLIDEVKELLNKGYNKNSTALQGLGYKEIIAYLEGKYSLDEAIEILKRDTRRFAKRQLTWFRRDERINWVNVDDYISKKDIVDYIAYSINENLL
ncbi:tRNA (adenosine(37)-N6)-dimethylallyltransferase MiaA [Abyssisolibacter fermentans]|uniref:tRNA (adenosine(37)-N6)-dimethylallyltransferase MiaA n=1 Tax=Abyssisolibacter fermentans TaxID=1766203 RepID=UPI000835100D|nr:tRNA (adenosine(37)-N6)-dimethylallyltransferase MiaA [Abyssisolibacter fermentans]